MTQNASSLDAPVCQYDVTWYDYVATR